MSADDRNVRFRPDHRALRSARREPRSDDRLIAHYVLETRLAAELLDAPPSERVTVYRAAYDTLFSELVDHPQHRAGSISVSERVQEQMQFLQPFLAPDQAWLEIGCGDASLSFAMVARSRQAYGVDVTDVLIDRTAAPANFRFVETDGTRIAVAGGTVDLAYSNQLLEHLHPDDALAHLREMRRVLRRGGRYVCRTPSRVTGPHDISAYFDYRARGFHLVEYDHSSLARLFREAGFRAVTPIVRVKGKILTPPLALGRLFDAIMLSLPRPVRAAVARLAGVPALAGVAVCASA
jgi:ubiquinone/menaquinone biosynthesis C-methylase UbiE